MTRKEQQAFEQLTKQGLSATTVLSLAAKQATTKAAELSVKGYHAQAMQYGNWSAVLTDLVNDLLK